MRMKRIVLVFMLLALVIPSSAVAVYDGEILFRNIPWYTDAVSFRDNVYSEIRTEPVPAFIFERAIKASSIVPYFNTESVLCVSEYNPEEIFYNLVLSAEEGKLVAGHPFSSVQAYAIPKVINGKVLSGPENSMIVHSSYSLNFKEMSDVTFAYNDLKSKLISLYGEVDYTFSPMENSSTVHSVWLGANNTYVALTGLIGENILWENPNYVEVPVSIAYGFTNIPELIDIIEHPEKSIDITSTDGL